MGSPLIFVNIFIFPSDFVSFAFMDVVVIVNVVNTTRLTTSSCGKAQETKQKCS